MAKILLAIGCAVFLGVAGVQVYRLGSQRAELQAKVEKAESKAEILGRENGDLEAEIVSLADPENLAKEFKKLFNVKAPGEKLYIIVPKESGE